MKETFQIYSLKLNIVLTEVVTCNTQFLLKSLLHYLIDRSQKRQSYQLEHIILIYHQIVLISLPEDK